MVLNVIITFYLIKIDICHPKRAVRSVRTDFLFFTDWPKVRKGYIKGYKFYLIGLCIERVDFNFSFTT